MTRGRLTARRSRRRGAALIVCIAVVAMLTLLATSFSFTTRLEIRAAHNFALGVQDNMSAVTGVTAARARLSALRGAVALNQAWARPRRAEAITRPVERDSDIVRKRRFSGPRRVIEPPDETRVAWQRVEVFDAARTFNHPAADVRVEDTSGRLNVNAVGRLQTSEDPDAVLTGPWDLDLAAALREMLRAAGLEGGEARELARAIVTYRHGEDGRPGRANVDDDLNGGPSSLKPTSDGVDNDLDGVVDNPEERFFSVAFNGLDDNGDGVVDDEREGAEFNGRDDDGDGEIDEPGDGVDDPTEFMGDLRFAAYGDDRPYRCREDLLAVPGMTPEILGAIAPHITVFSCVADVIPTTETGRRTLDRTDEDTPDAPRIPVNQATARQIEVLLRERFPRWGATLARQFAANLVDARDPDRVPTRLADVGGRPILGVEITPYINEVFPDSPTESTEGDDGQYVELYNPYGVELPIEGWSLNVGQRGVRLNGVMPPGSFLVVTDDYTGARDRRRGEQTPGTGSFYDVFGLTANGRSRRILENPALDLPDDWGEVRLLDAEGNLIDFFAYRSEIVEGVRQSYQRDDPRVRVAERRLATPFGANMPYAPPDETPTGFLFDTPEQRDRPFASVGELLRVYAGCGDEGGTQARPWTWPTVESENETEPDLRLIDVFCLQAPPTFEIPADDRYDLGGLASSRRRLEETMVVGRLNINTATREAMAAVPYEFPQGGRFADRVFDRRNDLLTELIDRSDGRGAPYPRLSDFFLDDELFGGLNDTDRVRVASRLVGALTTESRSFRITSRSLASGARDPRRGTTTRGVEALVCLSDVGRRLVTWRYIYDSPRLERQREEAIAAARGRETAAADRGGDRDNSIDPN